MKTKILLITLLAVSSLVSCDKDKILENIPGTLSETVESGTWAISYFWDSDKDETSHFSGFDFTFESDGVLNATNGTDSYSGAWSTLTDDSHLELNINFLSPEDFQDLTDDWHIIEFTKTTIKLEDISGGDGSIDYLTFLRN